MNIQTSRLAGFTVPANTQHLNKVSPPIAEKPAVN
jgi:hypothetical protein